MHVSITSSTCGWDQITHVQDAGGIRNGFASEAIADMAITAAVAVLFALPAGHCSIELAFLLRIGSKLCCSLPIQKPGSLGI